MDFKKLFWQKSGAPKERMAAPGGPGFQRIENRLRERILADPHGRGQRLELADLLVRQGRTAEAVTQYLTVADSHVDNDEYEHAIRLLKKALDADPQDMDVAERLARFECVRTTLSRRDRILELLSTRMRGAGTENRLTPRELRQSWPGIGGSPLIADLSDDQLARLFDVMEVRKWRDRLVLGRQGQHQAQSHLIVYGKVEAVTMTSTGDSRVLLLFGSGDLIGDSLLLGDTHLQATYRTADAETTALRLTKRGLNEALDGAIDRPSVLDALRRHGRDREIAALLG